PGERDHHLLEPRHHAARRGRRGERSGAQDLHRRADLPRGFDDHRRQLILGPQSTVFGPPGEAPGAAWGPQPSTSSRAHRPRRAMLTPALRAASAGTADTTRPVASTRRRGSPPLVSPRWPTRSTTRGTAVGRGTTSSPALAE